MITKEQAQQNGFKTIEIDKKIIEQKNEKLEALKKLIPNLVNSDGQVDKQALDDFIDLANTTSNNKGYELTFAGKGLARAKASSETTQELKAETGQSKDFETTDNVVIRGDNLEVLKVLQQNYHEKIKMIYIDPPYNTKSENFIYNDNFKQNEKELINNLELEKETIDFLQNIYGTKNHSGWLYFMYPRLKLARDLLKEDSVIFISIDDNEQANLKIICDEIFGDDNFVDCIVWNNKYTLQNDAKYTCSQYENILFYAKSKDNFLIGKNDRTDAQNKSYKNPDNDPKGAWKATPLHAKSGTNTPASVYSITFSNGKTWSVPSGRFARFSKAKLLDLEKENELYFNKKGGVDKKTYLSDIEKKGVVFSNLWRYEKVGHTHGNNEELADLVGKGIFDNPKGVKLIKQICKVANIQNNDIILDFFAGSGTTGDAVMQLNAEDGGNRKFILVQWDEEIKENTEAHKFCTENKFKPVISSICIERLNRAGEKIKKESQDKKDLFKKDKNLDIGYKVFSLTEKPKIAEQEQTDENQQTIESFKLESKRTETINTLYNMLCATCKPLHTKITELIKDKLYQADNEIYLLAEIDRKNLKPYKDRKINIDGWSNISLENWLNLEIEQKENIIVIY